MAPSAACWPTRLFRWAGASAAAFPLAEAGLGLDEPRDALHEHGRAERLGVLVATRHAAFDALRVANEHPLVAALECGADGADLVGLDDECNRVGNGRARERQVSAI